MNPRIIRRQYAVAPELAALPPLLQRIYAARGIRSPAEIERGTGALLHANGLKGMDDAVNLLRTAIERQQTVAVIGDYDADGATGVAVAVRALRKFGLESVHYFVPNRFDYGYGLTPEIVRLAHKRCRPHLLITVDNGIACVDGVREAGALGVKVLITDHHLPGTELPAATALVNPNQTGCPFASKALAGVGVIFYVMSALRAVLRRDGYFAETGLPEPNLAQFLDLVALGTVADLVPLDQNNRILVYQGLQRIRAGRACAGIRALLQAAGRDPQYLQTEDIAFAVGPRLNAAGRLQDMSLGIECLLTDDEGEATRTAARLHGLNEERRAIERDMHDQASRVLENMQFDSTVPYGLCLFDERWHQGVIGILASKIKAKWHRPTVIFACDGEDGLKGSARSVPGVHIRDVLATIDNRHPGLMRKFGGHAMAAGLSLMRRDLDRFRHVFTQTLEQTVGAEDLQEQLFSDGELTVEEMTLDMAEMLEQAGPWGQRFAAPLFDGVFEIVEQRLLTGKHLKLKVKKYGYLHDAIYFFVDTNKWPNANCREVRLLYRPVVNRYLGQSALQLLVAYLPDPPMPATGS